jgi:hypothetical protein
MLTAQVERLHVRFNGRSEDLRLGELGLQPDASDTQLIAALARRYECAESALEEYVIVREPQAIIVRPIAFYG